MKDKLFSPLIILVLLFIVVNICFNICVLGEYGDNIYLVQTVKREQVDFNSSDNSFSFNVDTEIIDKLIIGYSDNHDDQNEESNSLVLGFVDQTAEFAVDTVNCIDHARIGKLNAQKQKKAEDNASLIKKIKVKNILQQPELPTGCECVSLTMLLNYFGYNVDKVTLVREYLPKLDFYYLNGNLYGADFTTTFAGDPESADSYGCYAPCITITANKYFIANKINNKAFDLTGTEFDDLLSDYIFDDYPVLIWITHTDLHESVLTTKWLTPDNKSVQWRSFEHCVVLTGYDKKKGLIYVSDPLVGNTSYDYKKLKQRYNEMGKQAVCIGKQSVHK